MTPPSPDPDELGRELIRLRRARIGRDLPGRLLDAGVRVMPAARRDWGRAMRAELAAIEAKPARWSFARGCLSAAAREFHLLRGAVHLVAVLGTLATLLAWTGTAGYPPLVAILYVMVWFLAVACWEARRAGMLGPTDDGAVAWLLRGAGYLIAGGIIALGVAHLHPATTEAVDAGTGLLVVAIIPTGYLLGLATVFAKRSAATARVLVTGLGSGLAAALVWVATVFIAPPIPVSVLWALALTGLAGIGALAANATQPDETRRGLLATLLAVTTTMGLIFVGVNLLAGYGPDSIIPHITPYALPADRISESRIEIVDPYVLLLVLGGLAGAALALAAVFTRRPAAGPARPRTAEEAKAAEA